jgi:addiction module RelE/StbE family toxin
VAYEVVWTPAAQEDYRQIIDYLLDKSNDDAAERFTNILFKDLTILESMPYIGRPHSKMSAVRELVTSSRYILFYTVLRQEIILLNIINTNRAE